MVKAELSELSGQSPKVKESDNAYRVYKCLEFDLLFCIHVRTKHVLVFETLSKHADFEFLDKISTKCPFGSIDCSYIALWL